MEKKKLVRITTISRSLKKLLEGQLLYMSDYYEVIGVSSEEELLIELASKNEFRPFFVPLTRKITLYQDLKCLYILYRFFRKERPYIVHTHTPKAGTIGMIASRLAGVKHRLHTVAGMPLLEAKGFKRFVLNSVEKLTYSCATKIYPNSYGLQNIILEEKFSSSDKMKVLGNGSSNGIDIEYFDPAHFKESDNLKLRKEYGINKDDKVLLYIGRLVGDKGINELIASLEQLENKYENLKLVLVGKMEEDLDPLNEVTLDKIKNDPNIIRTGYQNDVRPFLAFADILTFPTYREGFPNVVLQAGAMNLPSIVTDINGCNEIVKDRYNGLIIRPKNIEDLTEAIVTLIENKEMYDSFKKITRKNIVEKYSRKEMWASIYTEYQSL